PIWEHAVSTSTAWESCSAATWDALATCRVSSVRWAAWHATARAMSISPTSTIAWCSGSLLPAKWMRSSGAPKMTKLSEPQAAAKRPGRSGRRGTRGIAKEWLRGITATVVVLGAVSLFTDISSEMIVPLRLIFLVQTLGAPLALAGLIEGIAEGATSLLKIL